MFLKKKKRIIELIDTICELINYVAENANVEMLNDVTLALESLYSSIENSKSEEDLGTVFEKINSVLSYLNSLDLNEITYEDLEELMGQIKDIEQTFLSSIEIKLNIVFMPYNVTMWDSLESIYNEAKTDESCVVKVVPIPYYDISKDEPILKYDGDVIAETIDIVNYLEYNLEYEEPDIIYVHNIYDNGNILTSVHPNYYTENLKKYTDMLVYSPYCVPAFLSEIKDYSFTFDLAGAKNVDLFISAGDFVKEQGLLRGISKDRILNLGCPKFDNLYKNLDNEIEIPAEWIEKANGRRVVLFPTSISYFILNNLQDKDTVTNAFYRVSLFMQILATYRENDIFVIWRPHPLTREFIKHSKPFLLEWFDSFCEDTKKLEYITLDKAKSYLPAFKFSDSLYTDATSLIYPYLMLNKKLILNCDDKIFNKMNVKYNSNKIGFQFNGNEDVFKSLVNFEKSNELKIETDFLKEYYSNLDGTSGRKIHYAVKNEVLKRNKNC